MSILPKAPVHYRISRGGKVVFFTVSSYMILRGFSGLVGDVPCFSEVRFLDFWDRRRGRDIDAEYFGGPATIEVLSTTGEVINRIGLANTADIAAHPRGMVMVAV